MEIWLTILTKSIVLFSHHHKNLCNITSGMEAVWLSMPSVTGIQIRAQPVAVVPMSNIWGTLWTCQVEIDVDSHDTSPPACTKHTSPTFPVNEENVPGSWVPELCWWQQCCMFRDAPHHNSPLPSHWRSWMCRRMGEVQWEGWRCHQGEVEKRLDIEGAKRQFCADWGLSYQSHAVKEAREK